MNLFRLLFTPFGRLFGSFEKDGHITWRNLQNDVSNFLLFHFVGAFSERPRAINGRPYTGIKKPYVARITCLPLR